MSKRIAGRNSHSPNDTHDHSEFTGTDLTQSDGTIKRGQDIVALGEMILGLTYDTLDVTYPTTATEVYTFSLAAVNVLISRLTYVTSAKKDLLKVEDIT